MVMTPEEKRVKDRERLKQWRQNNPDKVLAARERRRKEDNESCRRYYAKNREAIIARVIARRKNNPNNSRVREKLLKERTPKWIDKEEIAEIYRKCPGGLHVDHIVPLWGLTADGYEVHGLHVCWNLRYLTPQENIQKGNRMRRKDHYAFDVTHPGYLAIVRKLRRQLRASRETQRTGIAP